MKIELSLDGYNDKALQEILMEHMYANVPLTITINGVERDMQCIHMERKMNTCKIVDLNCTLV